MVGLYKLRPLKKFLKSCTQQKYRAALQVFLAGYLMNDPVYQCPMCCQPLLINEGKRICGSCQKDFSSYENITVFPSMVTDLKENDSVPGVIPEGKMKNLIESLGAQKEKPWEQIYAENITAEGDYVTNPTRADFKALLPLGPDIRVLEIGSSMGQICLNIAPSVKEIYGLEMGKEQVQIASLIATQRGIQNSFFARGGENGALPYQDGVFDLVILNNVIEWVGRGSENPVEIQRTMIKHICRVLKPGGVFVISTKNRRALQYWTGKDEHTGLFFSGFLPRGLLRWFLKCLSKPFVHLFSIQELCRELSQKGLETERAFWVIPDVRQPKYYIPLEDRFLAYLQTRRDIRAAMHKKYRCAFWVLSPGIFKKLIYSFLLIGRKRHA